jgi:branched-chain amino acid transport system substrate-binding protein
VKRILVLLFAICQFQICLADTKAPSLEIGLLVCLTGDCADWGTATMQGAQLAARELNERGGILGRTIRLRIEDTSEAVSGAKAVTAFKKLSSIDSLNIMIGPSWAPGARAILPLVAKSNRLLVITPSASFAGFARAADHIFNMRASEEAISRALANYTWQKGWRTAAIFSSQQPAEMENGRVFEEEFKELGGTVTLRVEPAPGSADLRTLATKIVASKPDVVYLISYTSMVEAARQLTNLGFTGPRLTISIDEARLRAAKGALDGVIVASFPGATDQFRDVFSQEFGQPPGLSAEGGYDAIYAIAKAAEQAGAIDVSQLKTKLKALQFEGASGKIQFDEWGQLTQIPVLMVADSEKLESLENG